MGIKASSYSTPREDLGVALHEFVPEGMEFAAGKILPELPVQKKAAALSVITRENLKRSHVDLSNGSVYPRVNLETEDLEYTCKKRGLEGQITDDDRENYISDFDAEMETAQVVKLKLLIERELRVKDLVFNTTTFTGASLFTDVSAAPWDAVGSDVIGHVLAAREMVRSNTGVKPNALVVGAAALANMLKNTAIRASFPSAQVISQELLEKALPAIFGLEELIVGGVVYDGAKEGQAFSGTDIWGDDYAMICRVQRGPTRTSPGLGRTVLWTRMNPNLLAYSDEVKMYREDQTDSDIVKVKHFTDEKIFDAYFGHLLKIDA